MPPRSLFEPRDLSLLALPKHHADATSSAGSVKTPNAAEPYRNPLRGPSASNHPVHATGSQ